MSLTSGDPKLGERWNALVETNYGTFRGFVRLVLGELEYLSGRLGSFTDVNPAKVSRLVFVCLGNINRSAFADVVARRCGVRVASIGLSTTTGAPAFEKAIEFAPLFGHQLEEHRATDFSDYVFEPGDLLLAMEVRHARELVRRGIPRESIALLGHWSKPHRIHIHDPHTLPDRYFPTCFAILHSGVLSLIDELRNAGSPCVVAK